MYLIKAYSGGDSAMSLISNSQSHIGSISASDMRTSARIGVQSSTVPMHPNHGSMGLYWVSQDSVKWVVSIIQNDYQSKTVHVINSNEETENLIACGIFPSANWSQ